MKKIIILAAVLALSVSSSQLLADWYPGDPYKMHYPQLPDPTGWDVDCPVAIGSPAALADDWQCSQSGPVQDIHFWYSWYQNNPENGTIDSIRVTIWSNNPSGPSGYSIPDQLLWDHTFLPGEWSSRYYGTGDQGWYDPRGSFLEHDHTEYYQVNITSIEDPFVQQEGEIYWLGLSLDPVSVGNPGWKTSVSTQFMDDAVWWDEDNTRWVELTDPLGSQSLDLAFVITGVPEPSSVALLCLGGLVFLRSRTRTGSA